MNNKLVILISAVLLLSQHIVFAQKATIKEEKLSFKTYPYSDPDPVAKMTKYYPYYRFDGMTTNSFQKEWNFVVLENDYIKVYVAPQIGGKIWGAIDKASGQDFIYFNNEVKFRDIAMRGAWTSGGIEFNFGSIGHSPATASPVNYKLVENNDGSVSCFVGAPDLTSRTEWRVEVRLPANKAYFETNGFWYNPTGERTSLYNWMTAATDAADDLEFIFPGTGQIGHGDQYDTWPKDYKDRDLSFYKNNNFGGAKSFHIVGSYEEYFSTFFHNRNFGMGHWAPREERPGMKIFLWALSRQGALWHNLLTDTDTNPQYVELQTGFLFNQAAVRSTYSPYKHLFFESNSENEFSEIWFPVKGTNGMVKADAYGTLNVIKKDGHASIKFCALQKIDGMITVKVDGKEKLSKEIRLAPLELFEDQLSLEDGNDYFIDIAGVFSYSSTEQEEKRMSRPPVMDKQFCWNSTQGLFTEALEFEKQRYYTEALNKYDEVLDQEPFHMGALTGKANILFKKMHYSDAEKTALKALAINTYEPDANYIYGIICTRLGKKYDALEAFGLAARSMKYRSAANVQMAEIYYREGDSGRAKKYASQALDYNRHNTKAYTILALVERYEGNEKETEKYFNEILKIDPLNALVAWEKGNFSKMTHFEMPMEIGLELGIKYVALGKKEAAINVLNKFRDNTIVKYWLAWLTDDLSLLKDATAMSPNFVYPFRSETAEVLEWALSHNKNWKTKYYLALIHWHKGNTTKAKELLSACGNEPDYAPFYLARGDFHIKKSPENTEKDYLKALSLNADQWRTYHKLVDFYLFSEKYSQSLKIAADARNRFPESYIAGYDYARAQKANHQYTNCLKTLKNITILPNEGARSGHNTYRHANILLALEYYKKGNYKKAVKLIDAAREWPENLGVGRPKVTDERIEDFLQSLCYKKLKNTKKAKELNQQIIDYTLAVSDIPGYRNNASVLLGALTLKREGLQEDAGRLMKEWSEANKKDKVTQWAMAIYSGDTKSARELAGSIKNSGKGTPWNPVKYDDTFEIVKDIYSLK